jgi:hypothetical protein
MVIDQSDLDISGDYHYLVDWQDGSKSYGKLTIDAAPETPTKISIGKTGVNVTESQTTQ